MTEFMRVDVTSDATTLADDAVSRLQDRWPDWEPADGDLAVVQVETLAPMAQNAAEVAAIVPPSIFRKIGTDIYRVDYHAATPATGTLTITLEDTAGHRIPAGSQFDIDGFVFATETDADVTAGSDTATGVTVVAADTGTDYNNLAGVTITPLSALDWLADAALDAPTGGGQDPEDDLDYQDRLARKLRLQAITLVTLRDHELFCLDYAGVGRAIALKLDLTHPRDVTITLADDVDGSPLSSGLKATILADLTSDTTRKVNDTITLADATYTTIDVDWTAVFLPGYEPGDVVARVNATLTDYLTSLNWGKPRVSLDGGPATDTWINETTVRWNKVVGIIESVAGVDYVDSLSLNGGGSGIDVTMTGDVTLTEPGTVTGAAA